MDRLQIVIDTREQTPWAFDPSKVSTKIGTIKTGDYAIEGDSFFGIERKSLDDFLGTVSTGWERFLREIERMNQAAWSAKIIIVEGDYMKCFFHQTNGELITPDTRHWRLTPQFIEKRIAELSMMGCSVLFAHNAPLAAGLAVAIFSQRQKQISNEHKN